jgi:hypothetical protein
MNSFYFAFFISLANLLNSQEVRLLENKSQARHGSTYLESQNLGFSLRQKDHKFEANLDSIFCETISQKTSKQKSQKSMLATASFSPKEELF